MKKPIKNNLVIELHVPNLDIVKNFYTKLGFAVMMFDEPTEKEQGYLTMTRSDPAGNTMLNFYGGDERVYTQSFFKQFSKDTTRGFEISITVVTSEIDQLYQMAQENLKANIVREIAGLSDHDHKWKDFRMVDPFGFYLRFTELIDWGQD
jgi:predicted lactoylglutathione lyase